MFSPAITLDKESPESRVMRRVKSVWTEAKNTYQIHEQHDFKLAFMSHSTLARVSNHPSAAACSAVLRGERGRPMVLVRVNKCAVEQNLQAVLDDVIPHELAHIVCDFRPQQGHSHTHDAGWAKVCKRLGGTGQAQYPVGTFNL